MEGLSWFIFSGIADLGSPCKFCSLWTLTYDWERESNVSCVNEVSSYLFPGLSYLYYLSCLMNDLVLCLKEWWCLTFCQWMCHRNGLTTFYFSSSVLKLCVLPRQIKKASAPFELNWTAIKPRFEIFKFLKSPNFKSRCWWVSALSFFVK
jgi:hypothetical protein